MDELVSHGGNLCALRVKRQRTTFRLILKPRTLNAAAPDRAIRVFLFLADLTHTAARIQPR